MSKEHLIDCYLLRFSEKQRLTHITLQNLKTGEQLEFETWVAAWVFLDKRLATNAPAQSSAAPKGS